MTQRIYSLDHLRILSACAVVATHVAALYVATTPVGSSHWWLGNFIDSFLRWCLPFFVMLSGALLLPKLCQNQPLAPYYRRRAGLLIPFAFWTVAYLLLHFACSNILLLDNQFDLPKALSKLPLRKPAHYHLWYFYMILPLLVLAPLLAPLSRRGWAVALVLLATAALQVSQALGFVPPFILATRFIGFAGYFIVGCWLVAHPLRWYWAILSLMAGILIFMLTYASCLSQGANLCTNFPFYEFYSPLAILLSLPLFSALLRLMPKRETLISKHLTPLTLGIYLIHPIFVELSFRLLPPPQHLPVFMLANIIAITVISAICTYVISQIPYLRRIIQQH